TQSLDALRAVDDAHEAPAGRGDDLLARERGTAALDHAQLRIDLVRAVDIDRDGTAGGQYVVELEHAQAVRARTLGGSFRGADQPGRRRSERSKLVDEEVDRGTAPHTENGADDEVVE